MEEKVYMDLGLRQDMKAKLKAKQEEMMPGQEEIKAREEQLKLEMKTVQENMRAGQKK